VTTIPENPRERYAAIVERVAAIETLQRRLREHETARQAHMARTEPELQEALQDLRTAEERVRLARAEYTSAGTSDLASVTQVGRLGRERDELEYELQLLQPWAPPGQGATA
jgi:chromosome segregation ATPase